MHQRGALQPGNAPQGGKVRLHDEVAVALVPARRLVAGHRLHIDVVGQQVVAAVRLLVGAVREEFRLEALADQAALHVHHGHQHGVDGAGADRALQLRHGEVACHLPVSRIARGRPRRSRRTLAMAVWRDKPPRASRILVHISHAEAPGPLACHPRQTPLYRPSIRPNMPGCVGLGRSLRLSVRTSDFQSEKTGSTPVGTATALIHSRLRLHDICASV